MNRNIKRTIDYTEEELFGSRIECRVLRFDTRRWPRRGQVSQLDLTRTKREFYHKSLSRDWGEKLETSRRYSILISQIPNKAATSRIRKGLLGLPGDNPWGHHLRHFVDAHGSRHPEICSTSLVVKETQILTTIKCHYTHIRTVLIKTRTHGSLVGTETRTAALERTCIGFQKLKIHLTYRWFLRPSSQRYGNLCSLKPWTPPFTVALFTVSKN